MLQNLVRGTCDDERSHDSKKLQNQQNLLREGNIFGPESSTMQVDVS